MTLMHIDFYSNVLGRSMQADVVLPETAAPAEGYPTLFLLHGMTDDHSMWQRHTSIERYADERRIAVVMPGTHLCWYANTHAGEGYFDYISDELVRIVRRMLPCLSRRREDTFVAGLSMGGYGAMRCALNRPDVFSRVASLSGAVDIFWLTQDPMPLGRSFCWEDVFGPRESVPGSDLDLFAVLQKRAAQGGELPPIYLSCGTKDALMADNLRLRAALEKAGYLVTWQEEDYGHEWRFWNRQVEAFIRTLPLGQGE